jgi:MFS family permease
MFGVAWPAFIVDAMTFFASFALISRIKAPRHTAGEAHQGDVRAVFVQLGAGMKLIMRTRVLLGTLVAAGVTMLGIGAVNVLMLPLIVNDLKVPVTWFGAVEFAQTSAMVLSGSLVALLAARLRPTNIVSMCLVGIGVVIGMTSLVGSIWHLFPLLVVVGFLMTPLQASIATIMQTSVDSKMRGRVGASLNTLISTASLLSMALAGIFAEALGVRTVFVLGGALTVVAGLAAAWVFMSPVRTAHEPSAPPVSMALEQMQ